jgi:hypothetical protein
MAMAQQLSNTSTDLSLMVDDLSNRVTKLSDNSGDIKLIKQLTDGPVSFVGAVARLVIKLPKNLLNTQLQLAEKNIELQLVVDKSENVVNELNTSIPEENWSSFLNSNNLIPALSQLSEELKIHKKVYELLQAKHSKYFKKLLAIFGEVSQDYNPEKFNLSRIDSLMSQVTQVLSHEKYYDSKLELEVTSDNKLCYHVNYFKGTSQSNSELNESRFHFLWYLCYLRIYENEEGIKRGRGIPKPLYDKFSSGLKSSLARGWNNLRDEFSNSAAQEQTKYKSNINSHVSNLIELNVDQYCLNRKINKKDINIPHL